jgi:hypothetical protein
MLKSVIEKALGSLLVAVIIGLSTVLYKEFETYNEIKNLLDIRHQLEADFKAEVKDRKEKDKLILNHINRVNNRLKTDSINLDYTKKWVDYWRGL